MLCYFQSISKIQLVVDSQSCVLIGWATTRLYAIAHCLVAKSAGFENQNNGVVKATYWLVEPPPDYML